MNSRVSNKFIIIMITLTFLVPILTGAGVPDVLARYGDNHLSPDLPLITGGLQLLSAAQSGPTGRVGEGLLALAPSMTLVAARREVMIVWRLIAKPPSTQATA